MLKALDEPWRRRHRPAIDPGEGVHGNIASPVMAASPMKEVASLWGGELPEFDTIEAANELVGALVMGLWNRLSRHRERSIEPTGILRGERAISRGV
ncbi:MAG: hypothetical protein WBO09_02325 [Methylocystis silviterrae]|uniref:hypothetical protein n=1 Tax=Methylocystis silviterrae TaxID=2743612 RepID=UPI003C71F3CD